MDNVDWIMNADGCPDARPVNKDGMHPFHRASPTSRTTWRPDRRLVVLGAACGQVAS